MTVNVLLRSVYVMCLSIDQPKVQPTRNYVSHSSQLTVSNEIFVPQWKFYWWREFLIEKRRRSDAVATSCSMQPLWSIFKSYPTMPLCMCFMAFSRVNRNFPRPELCFLFRVSLFCAWWFSFDVGNRVLFYIFSDGSFESDIFRWCFWCLMVDMRLIHSSHPAFV